MAATIRTAFLLLARADGLHALLDVVPVCELCVALLPGATMQLPTKRLSKVEREELSKEKEHTVIAETPHSVARRGMSLCAVLRPSLTPVRSLTVTGMSPKDLFIPTTILPSRPAASSTDTPRVPHTTSIHLRARGKVERIRTRRPTTGLVHEVDGASAVDVDEVEVSRTLAADDFGGGDKELRLAAGDLHAEDTLGGVPADEGPFFLRALEEGHRQTH